MIIELEDAIRAAKDRDSMEKELTALREENLRLVQRKQELVEECEQLKRENTELQIRADAICEGCQYATHYKNLEAALREIADDKGPAFSAWARMTTIARTALEKEGK